MINLYNIFCDDVKRFNLNEFKGGHEKNQLVIIYIKFNLNDVRTVI